MITNLKPNDINAVAGGNEDLWQAIKKIVIEKYPIFSQPEIAPCINEVCNSYSVTLCVPEKKPANCTYESWGKIHDLPEEMPRC